MLSLQHLKGCEFTYTGPKYLSDSVVSGYFKKSIRDALVSKGLVYNSDNPDLLVDVHVTVENKSEVVYHRNMDAQLTFLPLADPDLVICRSRVYGPSSGSHRKKHPEGN